MGKFRRHDGSVMLYDSTDDEKKLYDFALNKIDEKSKTVSEWIGMRLSLQRASASPLSIQQFKQDIRHILATDQNTNDSVPNKKL